MNDVEGTKTYASKQSPPSSFFQLQQDCLLATQRALKDSHRLLEIEFPPLPASVLELDDVSAYDVAQANLNLAVEFSKGMIGVSLSDDNGDSEDDGGEDDGEDSDGSSTIQNVAILLPDEDEKCIAIERYSGKSRDQVNDETYKVEPGVIVSSLRRGDPNDDRFLKVSVKLRYVTLRYAILRFYIFTVEYRDIFIPLTTTTMMMALLLTTMALMMLMMMLMPTFLVLSRIIITNAPSIIRFEAELRWTARIDGDGDGDELGGSRRKKEKKSNHDSTRLDSTRLDYYFD
jgi:hypothetical protein